MGALLAPGPTAGTLERPTPSCSPHRTQLTPQPPAWISVRRAPATPIPRPPPTATATSPPPTRPRPRRHPSPALTGHHKPVNQTVRHFAKALGSTVPDPRIGRLGQPSWPDGQADASPAPASLAKAPPAGRPCCAVHAQQGPPPCACASTSATFPCDDPVSGRRTAGPVEVGLRPALHAQPQANPDAPPLLRTRAADRAPAHGCGRQRRGGGRRALSPRAGEQDRPVPRRAPASAPAARWCAACARGARRRGARVSP